jgi:Icc-related predicted phosphoesterase
VGVSTGFRATSPRWDEDVRSDSFDVEQPLFGPSGLTDKAQRLNIYLGPAQLLNEMKLSRRSVLAGVGGVAAIGGVTGGGYWARVHEDNMEPQEIPDEHSDDSVRIGVLGDSHWRREERMRIRGIGSSTIVSSEELKENLSVFIDDMNGVFDADVVVQVGDLVDGVGVDRNIQLENLQNALDYLSNGLDTPVQHLLGNHEFAYAGQGMDEVFEVYGWGSVQGSWARKDFDGVSAIFLNTAASETSRSESVSDHYIPDSQLEWMESLADSVEQPVISFGHVPLTSGDGTEYDSTAGSERALSALHELDYRLGVFGHSHHADGWDRVRNQPDEPGVSHLNVPTPNAMLPEVGTKHSADDWLYIKYGVVPYLKLVIEPDGTWTAYASYHGLDIDLPTRWQG